MYKFKLKSKSDTSDSLTEYLSDNYNKWRTLQSENKSNKPFFQLYTDFLKYLPALKSGSVSLYLYYGFHANNSKGDSWHSVETIARNLNVTERSINNWNKSLIDLGLIYRVKGVKKSAKTYLLPLSDYYIEINKGIKEYFEKYKEDIDGKLVACYHLFQWRKGEGAEYNVPYNLACFVFEKTYVAEDFIDIETKEPKEYKRRKFVITNDIAEDIKKINMDASSFNRDNPICCFNSDILDDIIENISIDISDVVSKGIAITSSSNLRKEKQLIEVLSEVRNKQLILDEFDEVELLDV